MRIRTRATVVCALFLKCAVAATAIAGTQSVTVIWDANGEPDVVSYRMFYGTQSRVYANHVDVMEPIAVVSNLAEGGTYYFAAVAYNSSGLESQLSAEISYTVPGTLLNPSPTPIATTTPAATSTPGIPADGLVNVSTRAHVTNGENVLVGGFIIAGNISRTVVLRALGPSLTRSGVENAASDPALTLFDSTGAVLVSNDDWNEQDPVASATGLAPTDPLESMVMVSLPVGAYTGVLDIKDSPGVALFELYQLGSNTSPGVVNLSARGRVGLGSDVMIVGFILAGNHATRVAVRAIGPSLSQAGISHPLADPELELYDGNGSLTSRNDNWRSDQEAEIVQLGLAPSAEQESAIIATLPAGNYSAVVRGVGGSQGVALVEIYALD